MPNHEAVFRLSPNMRPVSTSRLRRKLADEVNPRSTISCRLEGDHTLVLTVAAQDTSSLRAALNMYLRLINVADEMQQIP